MMLKMAVMLCAAAAAALAQQPGPVMSAVLTQYENAKRNMVEAAQAMPEAEYNYKLTPEQRPYGAWIEHTAGMNLSMCGRVKGEPAPAADYGDKSRAALVKALEGSFAYCDSVLKGLSDEAAAKVVAQAPRPATAIDIMLSQIAQLNSHYGNLVGYLRTKGITPPTTARAQKKK